MKGELKNAVLWDVPPCRSCMNRSFGGTYRLHLQQNKLRGFRPQANYIDRATAACRRIEGIAWSAQRILTAANLGFLDRSRHFLEIAPQLSS
jgi:hypothetical protein